MLTNILSAWLIISGILPIYYWVDFFTKGGVLVVKDDWYTKFQKAFPPADMWASACCIIAGVGLLTEQTYGLVFALLAASSLLFLALMDITFNLQNNLYSLLATSSQMKLELVVNIWTLSLGIILIAYTWPKII